MDKEHLKEQPIDLVKELSRTRTLSPLRNSVLTSLMQGFQTDFPVQSALFFKPENNDVSLHMIFPKPKKDKKELRLPKHSFVHERVPYYFEHDHRFVRLYPPSEHWNPLHLNGIEKILDYTGIQKSKVTGVADFVFPVSKMPIVAVLINPLSPESGVATREVVPFVIEDQERLEKFLEPYFRRIEDIEAATYEAGFFMAEQMFGFPGLIKTPSIKECEAESFLEQKVGNFGGDFLYAAVKDNRALYFLGDVMGKSIPASGLNSCLRNSIALLAIDDIPELEKLMYSLNSMALKTEREGLFATGFAFTVDKNGELVYSGAAHEAYILRTNGSYQRLKAESFPLGTIEGTEYKAQKIKLEPGDTIAVWSDGYSENMNANKDIMRDERVVEHLAKYPKQSLKDMIKNLETKAAAFSSEGRGYPDFPDDRTVLLVRYKGNR